MKRTNASGMIGFALVVAGLLILLENFGFFGAASDLIWSLLFILGGLAFLTLFLREQAQWWAAIPGFTLMGIGTLIGLDQIFPRMAEIWGGSIFLGMIGLSFVLIFLTHPRYWWAMIPGGVLLTLSAVAGSDRVFSDQASGSIFFLGLAVTFGLLYLIPTPSGHMTWPLFPAAAALVLGAVTLSSVAWAFNYIWPVAVMIVGLYLIYRTLQPRQPEATPSPPAAPISETQEERYEDQTLPQPH
ncbi:MAG TPA: hypothetical protein VFZ66_12860 [Herpetosiphonaceae bacterium]